MKIFNMDNKLSLVSNRCTDDVHAESTVDSGCFLSLLSDSEKAQLLEELLVESSNLISNLLIRSKRIPLSLREDSVEFLSVINEIKKNQKTRNQTKLKLVYTVGN